MTKRPGFKQFRAKALKNPAVRAEYDALSSGFELRRRMIAMRLAAGVTQEQMAQMLDTQKSNISRLENVNSEASPRLATVEAYARALGYAAKVEFEPA